MSKISLEGNVSGSGTLTIAAPNTNSNFTLSLPTNTGTIITQNSTPAFASTIGVGGATAAASGAGITFPATQSASSDANTLDDYEEGTWTPILFGGFSTAPTGYTVQDGGYIKIGKYVYCQARMNADGAVANASLLSIGGLPFTSGGGGTNAYGVGVINYQSSFNTNAGDTLEVNQNSTTLSFYTNAGANRLGNAANVNINADIIFNVFYISA